MTLSVTTTLHRLFARQPQLAVLFQPSGYPAPDRRPPPALHGDFVDTRPVVFRGEAFEEDSVCEPVSA